jgi:hypothetical protein
LSGGFDNPGNIPSPPKRKGRRTAAAMRTTMAALRQTLEPSAKRDSNIHEVIFENLGAAVLFAETAQLLIEARDDADMTHAVRMGACHYRAAVQTMKELAPKGGAVIERATRCTESWELDALSPSIIDGLVDKAICDLIDFDVWREAAEREEQGREKLQRAAELIEAGHGGAA